MHVLAVPLSLVWLLIAWRIAQGRPFGAPLFLFMTAAALIAVFLSSPALWQAAYAGYPQDSFFTLKTSGRAGVLAISVVSILIFFILLAAKSRSILRRTGTGSAIRFAGFLADCGLGLAIFGFLYSLSPQIYYTFYRLIIPGLPNQLVIKSVFDWERLHLVAGLDPDHMLARHLAGAVLLAIVPFTALIHSRDEKWQREGIILTIPAALALQYGAIF